MSKAIHADRAPQFPLPFSHAVRAGDFVYVSGQVGVNPETGKIAGQTIEEQTEQTLRNIEIILEAEGLTLDHVVKTNSHLTHAQDIPKYNEVYERKMKRPYPARTTVRSGIGDYLIEIDVVAYALTRRGEE
ncbi:RidA family protein [Paenibacillus filicis]|uniref:RidA family protein n=1 Tax=Paenibacillus gyeongsangnamensis TaxID=3388067 RepID=A0ABT4QKJ5_9BACL|nr:RidA family protein [Paenibacillus filicis]MCZ8517327.1 RidA family protein [Paenibacillus filicis]